MIHGHFTARPGYRRGALCFLLATLSALVLSGCTSSEPTQVSLRPEVNEWKLPLTSKWNKSQTEALLVIEDFVVAECLGLNPDAARVRAAVLSHDELGKTWNTDLRRIFTPEIARTRGYRTDAYFPKAISNPYPAPTTETVEWKRCFEKLREEHPLPPYEGLVQEIQSIAYQAAVRNNDVRARQSEWRTCLSAAVPDVTVPESPAEMPPESLASKWSVGQDGTAAPAPSTEEVALAVRDAQCRVSSGYLTTLHQVETSEQLRLIKEHADQLDIELTKIHTYEKGMRDLVGAPPP